jgi:hypothetical protein
LVASAPIQARNLDTGARFSVNSGDAGQYRLTGLPAGSYEITISITGTPDFVQRVVVTATQALRLDIILPLG